MNCEIAFYVTNTEVIIAVLNNNNINNNNKLRGVTLYTLFLYLKPTSYWMTLDPTKFMSSVFFPEVTSCQDVRIANSIHICTLSLPNTELLNMQDCM